MDSMNFQDYINLAWKIHAQETETVFESLGPARGKLVTNDDIVILARLITHICGDHFIDRSHHGIELLQSLKNKNFFLKNSESEIAVDRSVAILKLSSQQVCDLSHFSISDQTRIFAQTAGILIEHKKMSDGQNMYDKAVALAERLDLTNKDEPAVKSLAITSHNVTCTFEEKNNRTKSEDEFMVFTSNQSLKFWSITGDVSAINQAQYRIANTYLQVGDWASALGFANQCYVGSLEHKLGLYNEFYGLEVLCLSYFKAKNQVEFKKYQQLFEIVYTQLSESEKSRAVKTLGQIRLMTF